MFWKKKKVLNAEEDKLATLIIDMEKTQLLFQSIIKLLESYALRLERLENTQISIMDNTTRILKAHEQSLEDLQKKLYTLENSRNSKQGPINPKSMN